MKKENCECENHNHEDCGCEEHHHEISTDDIARHNHLVLNALIKTLIEKKLMNAEDINKAAIELQKMAQEKSK